MPGRVRTGGGLIALSLPWLAGCSPTQTSLAGPDADSTHLIIWTCHGTNQRWTLS